MLNKNVTGRLGNQLFQYAALRAFQEKYARDEPINLDFKDTFHHLDDGFTFELLNFNIQKCHMKPMKKTLVQRLILKYILVRKVIFMICCKINKSKNYDQRYYEFEKRNQKRLNRFGIYSINNGYIDLNNSKYKNKIFIGTYESSKYFLDIKDILMKEFTPKYDVIGKNIKFLEKIENEESVCVSIRRGDFVENPVFKKRFYVCRPDYFEEAIKIIKKKVKNPNFFIFSDDIEWCKKNLKFLPKDAEFEPLNNPVYEKLRLMYSCKHFIISNSTFSWWAQFLSRNEKKIVIAPKVWRNNTYHHECYGGNIDIYEKGWILIDNINTKEKNEK